MPAPSTRLHSSLEHLEYRIAPAGIVYTYTDVDGDAVTLKITKGTIGDVIITKAASGIGEQLLKIDLNGNPIFQGASITVTAHPVNGLGNGKANVGYIKATDNVLQTGIDLASVIIQGDLGRIEAGDYILSSPGIKLLSVDSMRLFPLDSTLADPATGVYDTVSHVKGKLTSLVVRGDFANAGLSVDSLGTAVILGNLIGNLDGSQANLLDFTGQLFSNTTIGKVVIRGDLVGGLGVDAGSIVANTGSIGAISIGGSVYGGSDIFSGAITAGGSIGSIAIKGDVFGGSAEETGVIYSSGASIKLLTIGGSLYGGSQDRTGEIFTTGSITRLTIGGNLVGGSSNGVALTESGYIQALVISNATVGGIFSGVDDGTGLTKSGSIRAVDNIGNLTVRRDIVGNDTKPVYIVGFGAPIQTKTDLAINSVTVFGSVQFGEILAGYDVDTSVSDRGPALNADAQIARVTIFGSLISSSIVAGVKTTDTDFGNTDDALIGGGLASIQARIGSVYIGGQAYGTIDSSDSATFGIAAQQIGAVRIGKTTLSLLAGVSNDTFAAKQQHGIGPTFGATTFPTLGVPNTENFDFHIYEVM